MSSHFPHGAGLMSCTSTWEKPEKQSVTSGGKPNIGMSISGEVVEPISKFKILEVQTSEGQSWSLKTLHVIKKKLQQQFFFGLSWTLKHNKLPADLLEKLDAHEEMAVQAGTPAAVDHQFSTGDCGHTPFKIWDIHLSHVHKWSTIIKNEHSHLRNLTVYYLFTAAEVFFFYLMHTGNKFI